MIYFLPSLYVDRLEPKPSNPSVYVKRDPRNKSWDIVRKVKPIGFGFYVSTGEWFRDYKGNFPKRK